MATGEPPFAGDSRNLVRSSLNRTPVPPVEAKTSVPPELERIISRALEKDRSRRYQSAAEMRADLQRVLAQATRQPQNPGTVSKEKRCEVAIPYKAQCAAP